MTDRFNEGMVLTWSCRWHWPAGSGQPENPARYGANVATLCKNQAYSRENLPNIDWLQEAAKDPRTPICKKCAKKVAKDDD